jgi:phosphatidylglycerophosphatase C
MGYLFLFSDLLLIMQKIVLFDFDGTITTKDTLFEFIRHVKGSSSLRMGLLILLPWLVAHKLGLLSSQLAKEKVLSFFLRGISQVQFDEMCNSFSSVLETLIRPKAVEKIKEYRTNNITIVIVSASIENWIIPWAKQYGAIVLATKLEMVDNRLTGRIKGKNCNGQNKVLLIDRTFELSKTEVLAAYGDTTGDFDMLELAKEKFFKPFR